jgi:hypothetical protein
MKTKQVPYDLYNWLKARTFVIGSEAELEPSSQGTVRSASNNGRGIGRTVVHKARWHP